MEPGWMDWICGGSSVSGFEVVTDSRHDNSETWPVGIVNM